MTRSKGTNHEITCQVVALLMQEPYTNKALHAIIGCHEVVPYGITAALHTHGIVWISGWVRTVNGKNSPIFQWQPSNEPFEMADVPCPYPNGAIPKIRKRARPVRAKVESSCGQPFEV